MKLKRLELHYQGFNDADLQAYESYRKESIDDFSCHIYVLGNNECETIFKLLQLEIVSEIKLRNINESLLSEITKAPHHGRQRL